MAITKVLNYCNLPTLKSHKHSQKHIYLFSKGKGTYEIPCIRYGKCPVRHKCLDYPVNIDIFPKHSKSSAPRSLVIFLKYFRTFLSNQYKIQYEHISYTNLTSGPGTSENVNTQIIEQIDNRQCQHDTTHQHKSFSLSQRVQCAGLKQNVNDYLNGFLINCD